jgi:phosphoglucosamine mutase
MNFEEWVADLRTKAWHTSPKPEADLKDTGRVLLRPSGTEPAVRVMVEAADEGTAQSWADRIARVVERRLAV